MLCQTEAARAMVYSWSLIVRNACLDADLIGKTPYRTFDSFGRVLSLHLPCFAMEGVQQFDHSQTDDGGLVAVGRVDWDTRVWKTLVTFPQVLRARKPALTSRGPKTLPWIQQIMPPRAGWTTRPLAALRLILPIP